MTDLHNRLEAAASAVEPRAHLWTDVERRINTHRRRPAVLVAIAAAAAVIATAVIVPRLGGSSTVRIPAGPDESGTWRLLPPAPQPAGENTRAFWVGRELVVVDTAVRTAEAYDPETDAWRTLTSPPLSSRVGPAEVAMGDRLLVWGGTTSEGGPLSDGALYDPVADTWTPVAPSPLTPRTGPYTVWTGTEAILWNGLPPMTTGMGTDHGLASGAAYNPVANSWRTLPDAPADPIPGQLPAVWTGSEMVLVVPPPAIAYNPATNAWRSFPRVDLSPGVMGPIGMHAVPTHDGGILLFDRQPKLYDASNASWSPMPLSPVVNSVGGFDPINAIATDRELVAWGPYQPGVRSSGTDTRGEAFDLESHTWRTFSVPSAITDRPLPLRVWSGKQIIAWGGESVDGGTRNAGWAYTPPADKTMTTPGVYVPTTVGPASPTTKPSVLTPTTSASAACPTQAELSARFNRKPRVVTTTEPSDPIQGEHLEPPPPGAKPPIDADQAYASARSYMAPDPGPDPTITLATFTSSMTGTHLAWVLVFRDAVITGPMGGPARPPGATVTTRPEPPCYLGTTVQPVDAENGIAMGMAQGG